MNLQLPGQKRSLRFGFLLMGFSFAVTQSLLIREFLVAFYGNELAIGLILANWLILEAVGSGLLSQLVRVQSGSSASPALRRAQAPGAEPVEASVLPIIRPDSAPGDRWQGDARSFAALQVLFALFLPLCLFAIYMGRRLVGAIPGEGVGLIRVFWSSLLILTPLGLIDGAMFAFGARSYARLAGDEASAIGRVYVLEAMGGIGGGVVFTYLFIRYLHSLQTVLVLSALNLLAAILIRASFGTHGGRRLSLQLGPVVGLLLATLVILLSPLAVRLQRAAVSQQWPGYHLLYSENSAYGNVSVVEREGQYTFLADGIPILNAPVPDVALSEEMVHLPMLFIPNPRRALVLSGGLGGVLHELTRYPLERIDYAELDPLLIQAVRQFPTPLTTGELDDLRLSIELVDGRLLVREMQGETPGYDLIIVNLPYPSTLQLNRFYTVEFFQMVRRLLAEDGVVVIAMPGSLSYLSDELRNLNVMAYHTLGQVFPQIRPIPGDLTLWLASPANHMSAVTVDALVARWEARGFDTKLVTPAHIRLRLDRGYLEWFWGSLISGAHDAFSSPQDLGEQPALRTGSGGAVWSMDAGQQKINSDFHPLGLFYGLSYWNALFSPPLSRVFALAERLNLWALALPLIAGTMLFRVLMRRAGKVRGGVIPLVIAATGFAGMTADLIIIFAFQSLYGHVYYWIALLLTAFMAGLALGGQLMIRRPASARQDASTFLGLEAAFVLFWLLLPLVLGVLHAHIGEPGLSGLVQAILFLLNALAGYLVGAQFPLANRLWLAEEGSRGGKEGALYASDLVGAFLGSIFVSVLLVPVLGIVQTCLLAAILQLCGLWLFATIPFIRLRRTTGR